MIKIVGTFNRFYGTYRIHKPTFPYDSVTFAGYSEREMKKRVRELFGLKGRHIEWIIL